MVSALSLSAYYDTRPGRWVGEEQWPSKQIESQAFHLTEQGLARKSTTGQHFNINSPQSVGMASGEYMLMCLVVVVSLQ